MSRVLLVGESNPYGSTPHFALYPDPPTSAGGRMQRLVAGLQRDTYIHLARVNLLEGMGWHAKVARASARRLLEGEHEVFVLLGRKVVAAFFPKDAPAPFTSGLLPSRLLGRVGDLSGGDAREVRSATARYYVALPHPSGLCRAWNEPDAFKRARAHLSGVAPEVPWGEFDA